MDSTLTSAESDISSSPIRDKLGDALLPGFTVIPAIMLREQHTLRLNDGEMLVAMHMLLAWWEKDRLPYTKSATIAKRMGVTARTVQRHMKGLEEKGCLRKVVDPSDSEKTSFDLAPLVARLQELGRKAHAARWKAQSVDQVGVQITSDLSA
ncbi:helix-turn-helix domain-containing protein [Burkholderia orbicola]|uniref:helix-turn-helix domain-containing protein n=1 Tax=Burkholderia orbicola TaxID=2978683 RepID=UPI002FE2C477